MKKRVEEYIPEALKALKDVGIVKNGKFSKEYNGYISSFGASIRQAGLLATIMFYSAEDSGASQDRKKIIEAIEQIIGVNDLKNHIDKKSQIEQAAIALKLAIRTFKKD